MRNCSNLLLLTHIKIEKSIQEQKRQGWHATKAQRHGRYPLQSERQGWHTTKADSYSYIIHISYKMEGGGGLRIH